MATQNALTRKQIAQAIQYCTADDCEVDPRVEALVDDLIGRVADKWTMLVLEALAANGVMRFTRIAAAVAGISQKMLTQTLRQMERDGLVTRTVHPVVPPHVDYELTSIGASLGDAFCGVWRWAGKNFEAIDKARRAFDQRTRPLKRANPLPLAPSPRADEL